MYLSFIALMIFVLAGCVSSRPIEEYTVAMVAIKSAKSVEAARYSPGHFHNAEESYRTAEKLFREREYEAAKEFFIKARIYAERAENTARITKFKEGEAF